MITGLSLFSGVDVARMAVAELGLEVDWYSSEIDKFAIQGAKALYDGTTYLGDMTKWDEWEEEKGFDFGKVDIIFAGFPCQSWSLAGKQKGDNDPRGALVHDLLDIWSYIKALNPNVKFLFENVAMKKEFLEFINEIFGYEPVMINSALLTAQNRKRNYWANWDISQPEDKGILLKDIIECTSDQKHVLSNKCVSRIERYDNGEKCLNPKDKAQCLVAGYAKLGRDNTYLPLRPCELRDTPPAESALCHHVATATDVKGNQAIKRVYADSGKCPTLTTMQGGHQEPKVLVGRVVGRKINPETGKRDDYNPDIKTVQRLEARPDEKSGCITTVQKDNVLIIDPPKYRKLTPRECMRLQGFTEEIIDKLLNAGISNSQLYKMTGNSFTLPVIIHDLQCLLATGWMVERIGDELMIRARATLGWTNEANQ